MDLGRGPLEGSCGLVVGFDEGCDMGLELTERVERRSPKRLACQDREPDLDLIQPGCSRRRKMEMHVRMAFQPAIVLRLVGIQIVEDDMNLAASCWATTRFMKSRNSTRRRRLYWRPVTLPVAMSKAAKSVVTPCRM